MADTDRYSAELDAVADALAKLVAEYDSQEVKGRLGALDEAVDAIERTWSKSNFGYHARVYYRDFETPPPGEMKFCDSRRLAQRGGKAWHPRHRRARCTRAPGPPHVGSNRVMT